MDFLNHIIKTIYFFILQFNPYSKNEFNINIRFVMYSFFNSLKKFNFFVFLFRSYYKNFYDSFVVIKGSFATKLIKLG